MWKLDAVRSVSSKIKYDAEQVLVMFSCRLEENHLFQNIAYKKYHSCVNPNSSLSLDMIQRSQQLICWTATENMWNFAI